MHGGGMGEGIGEKRGGGEAGVATDPFENFRRNC